MGTPYIEARYWCGTPRHYENERWCVPEGSGPDFDYGEALTCLRRQKRVIVEAK